MNRFIIASLVIAFSTSCAPGIECLPGFDAVGGECIDHDECADPDRGGCSDSPFVACSNPRDGTHACGGCTPIADETFCGVCPVGYQGDGRTCVDYDECATGNGGCDPQATCRDTGGRRTCSCNLGFNGDGVTCSPNVCTPACHSAAFCDTGNHCRCPAGTTSMDDGRSCLDVDECASGTDNCHFSSTCTNADPTSPLGGPQFTCACGPGWTGDGVRCVELSNIAPGDAQANCGTVAAGGAEWSLCGGVVASGACGLNGEVWCRPVGSTGSTTTGYRMRGHVATSVVPSTLSNPAPIGGYRLFPGTR